MRLEGRYVELLRTYVGPQWRRAALLAALLLVSIALQLVGPQLLRYFIDGAIGGVAVETLALVALGYVVVALVTQLLTAWAQYVGEDVGPRSVHDVDAKVKRAQANLEEFLTIHNIDRLFQDPPEE